MLWTNAGRAAMAAILILAGTAPGWAAGLGFSAAVDLEITYTPIPPASYDIGSELGLTFAMPGFTLTSDTGFNLSGFAFERVEFEVDLGAAQIAESIRFEPGFDWNQLSFDLAIACVQVGVDWIFADIAAPPTPDYQMGVVLAVRCDTPVGLSVASATGFGAADLADVLGGTAPFSEEALSLFEYVATLCAPAPASDPTILAGFAFEEEILRLTLASVGLVASHTTWLDAAGLQQMGFELGYQLPAPQIGLLAALLLDGTMTITHLDLILDVFVEGVRFTSWTEFAEPLFPVPVPILFAGQRFAVSFEVCEVRITSQTDFDDLFLFAGEQIAIEATIPPVTFVSLTSFDAGGFAAQCIEARLAFDVVELWSAAEFAWDGLVFVLLGFSLAF